MLLHNPGSVTLTESARRSLLPPVPESGRVLNAENGTMGAVTAADIERARIVR